MTATPSLSSAKRGTADGPQGWGMPARGGASWPLIARFQTREARLAARMGRRRSSAFVYEFVRFGVKQAWACLFGGAMMALLLGLFLVSLFVWLAENAGTWAHAWVHPHQLQGWHRVSLGKLGSWFLLLVVSYTLVAWVRKPQPMRPLAQRKPPLPRLRINTSYLAAFVVLLVVETGIALFVTQPVARGMVGDVLVVILLYCAVQGICSADKFHAVVAVVALAFLVELFQLFQLTQILGLAPHSPLGIILGSVFDVWDLLAYLTGGLVVYLGDIHPASLGWVVGRQRMRHRWRVAVGFAATGLLLGLGYSLLYQITGNAMGAPMEPSWADLLDGLWQPPFLELAIVLSGLGAAGGLALATATLSLQALRSTSRQAASARRSVP